MIYWIFDMDETLYNMDNKFSYDLFGTNRSGSSILQLKKYDSKNLSSVIFEVKLGSGSSKPFNPGNNFANDKLNKVKGADEAEKKLGEVVDNIIKFSISVPQNSKIVIWAANKKIIQSSPTNVEK
jgi:hypothetical protein